MKMTDPITETSPPACNVLSEGMYGHLFPRHLEIVPQLNEVYELALAFYESRLMDDDALIHNSAYFARVGKRLTRHYLMCTGEPVRLPKYASSRLRSFFENNQFKTGFATHGLFPYRGKFHPQMIKGLINVMGLKSGDTLLDPMMGSGTALIEASLMGIRSIGFDTSPFCQFMTQVKVDGLRIERDILFDAGRDIQSLFDHFTRTAGNANCALPTVPTCASSPPATDFALDPGMITDHPQIYNLLLLAYLDSVGYAERSSRQQPLVQFKKIVERYLFVIDKIQNVLNGSESDLAEAFPHLGDAREMPLDNESVEGILFSPPYSFAIDYLQNDAFHLNYFRQDIGSLREKMIGLRGNGLREKYDLYIVDMDKVLAECHRVLKPGRFCTIVVGTNDRQLSRVLNVSPEHVPGLHKILSDMAINRGFSITRMLSRRISGIANTMRNEYIVFMRKNE